jgi:hypothetical protein
VWTRLTPEASWSIINHCLIAKNNVWESAARNHIKFQDFDKVLTKYDTIQVFIKFRILINLGNMHETAARCRFWGQTIFVHTPTLVSPMQFSI